MSGAQARSTIAAVGLASTVTVETQDHWGRHLGQGSGFVIAAGLILTNAHVVGGSTSVQVRWVEGGGAAVEAQILHSCHGRDLALLGFDFAAGPALVLRTEDAPAIGDDVYVVGSPYGLEGTFSAGLVSSYRHSGGELLMQITAPVSPGSSGGPVLDDNARVVGVVVSGVRAGQNLNFVIPTSVVMSFLEEHPASGTVAATKTVGNDARPSFDCDRASTWSEHAICSSAELAALDVALNQSYANVRTTLDAEQFERVRADQRSWLVRREACADHAAREQRLGCLARAMESRTAELDRLTR